MGCCGGGHRPAPKRGRVDLPDTTAAEKDPLTILKLRLAKGEITEQEYDRLVEVLRR